MRVKPASTKLVHFAGQDFSPITGPVREAKSVVLSYPAELFFGIADAQIPDAPLSARTAHGLFALCYACMTYRATKMSEPPLWIFEEQDGEEVPIEGDHPLAELLERPNPDMEMSDFIELVSLYLDATAAVLIVKNDDFAGVPRSMYPYAKDEFTVEPADGRLFGKFKVRTLTGYRELGPEQVIYLRRPSTANVMATTAPMDAALSHINIGHVMRTAIKAAMRHTVRPGTIFEAPGELGTDAFDRLKSEIAESYAGLWNMGKSMLTEGGIKAQVQKPSLDDLALGPVNQDVEVAVCQAFQVHPILIGSRIGVEGNAGFADSIKPAESLFYDVAAIPAWTRIEKALTRGLLRAVDPDPLLFIRFDKSKVRALQEDIGEKITQAKTADGIWTEEEQRQWTGKEGGSTELPSEKAERVAEENAAMAQANEPPNGKSRIVDLVKTEAGWKATIGTNGNGTH